MPFAFRTLAFTTLTSLVLATTPAPAQTFLQGIDVSLFQDTVNWAAVRDAGVEFAFARASRGETYNDPLFLANMRGAAKAGVLIGPYHYCNLDTNFGNLTIADAVADATTEANHFLGVIKPYYDAGLQLPPVADVEGFPDVPAWSAQAKTYTSAWVTQFSNTINDALGVRPLIYGSLSKVNSYYTPAVASQHDLWLAWWKASGTSNPPVAADTPLWGAWSFWQWTDNWTVDGIVGAVDGDLFNGNRAQLESLLHGAGPLGGLPGGRIVLTDYDGGTEGYFGFSPTYSGSNQGISSVTADRVTSQAHEGAGSQQIVVTPSGGNWTLRFLSGIGATPFQPAHPDSNLPLDSQGSIGFWLKTDASGVSVRLALDDSDGTERSVIRSIVGDNQWHLYEWDFDNAAHWDPWLAGSNGTINAATVTVDSIIFTGNAATTLYMDTFAHNPGGSLAPIPGDFNRDWLVDGRDLDVWKTSMGVDARGDADADGDTDGADLLIWQRSMTPPAASAATAPVPEPTSLALGCAALIAGWHARRRGR